MAAIVDNRFQANLKRMPNGCLEWQLWTDENGYGWVRRRKISNSYLYAHRYAWYLEYGVWPVDKLLHRCDNPPCCDLNHLFEGSQQDNIADMMAKGRHHRTVSDETIQEVRAASGTVEQIGKRFGVSPSYVWDLRKGIHVSNRTGLADQLRALPVAVPVILTPKRPASIASQAHLLGIRIRTRSLRNGQIEVTRLNT